MTQILVGTTPVQLPIAGRQSALVQNVSNNDLYLDADPAVSTTTGVHIPAGSSLALPIAGANPQPYFAVATADGSDVRLLVTGGPTARVDA